MQTQAAQKTKKGSGQKQKPATQGEPKITTNLKHATSAVGAHFDDETAIAALAYQYYQEEGCPEGREQEHWMRAKEELERRRTMASPSTSTIDRASKPSKLDAQVEEAMHLDR